MRTSIRDIAREAGVSYVTVANVLNGHQNRASAATSERVLQAARSMNYIPVAPPSTQRRHVETRVIGLVYDHMAWEDYWGLSTFAGLRDGALEHGYDLMTILRQAPLRPADQQELRFLDRRCDGLIFLLPEGRNDLFRVLVEHEVPTVACYVDDVPQGIASVVVDNQGAMRLAVQHLVEAGHRRILFVNYSLSRSDFNHRTQGYRDAMAEADLECRELFVDEYQAWEKAAARDAVQRQTTAIVCSADSLALKLRGALLSAGMRVPEDISLVGMDDMPAAEGAELTTMRISAVEVGRQAMEVMVRRIAGDDAQSCHRIVPSILTERRSVASPAH